MAIFRPEGSSSSNNNFYGVCEIAILGFEDKSSDFEWADIYLDVEVKQRGSDYTKQLRIVGDLEKDTNGKISGGSVLKRMYNFFDIIGEKAGLTVDGKWEDESGDSISNIAAYLNQKHVAPVLPGSPPSVVPPIIAIAVVVPAAPGYNLAVFIFTSVVQEEPS